MRLNRVLADGEAAELACYLGGLPLAARQFADHEDLSWSCEIGVPEDFDPQHPACLYRLVDFLDHRLPPLASAVVGRELAPVALGRVHVWAFRCGAHVDAGAALAPAGGVDVILGLTAGSWPASWGGHLVVGDRAPLPLGPNTLDLLSGNFRVSLVTRHVQALAVRAILRPA